MEKFSKKVVFTKTASLPIGAYSQAIVAGKTIYVGGCVGELEYGELAPGRIKQKTEAALDCLKHILLASGSNFNNVLKVNVFLRNVNDYDIFNEVFKRAFEPNFPARTCVGIGKLAFDGPIQIEAIALIGENTKKVITTAAHPISASYSQATVADGIIYISGCVGQLKAGELLSDGIQVQTETALNNLRNILLASGSSFNDVLKITVYLQNFQDYETFDKIYRNAFASDFPVRTCVEVKYLPVGALIEIDAVALIGKNDKVSKQVITSQTVPLPSGAYSQAIVTDNIVYVAGHVAESETGRLVGGDIKEQTVTVINNLRNILIDAGSSINNVLKATVYLRNFNDYVAFEEVFRNAFAPNFPARTTIEVGHLDLDALIEIDVIALIED